MNSVAMIGVGKLGQDCAEVMAQYYDVVGYDISPRNPSFKMCNTIQEAVTDRDIIFIAAPTPHDSMYGGETPTSHLPNKDFDYTIVTEILQEVNKYVNQNQLVVLISTVLPGTVRRELRPCITNARFIYNPYLIAMGTVKFDMVNPEMIIIGTEDGSITGDAKELIDFYQPMMQNNPRIEVGTWDEAEAIKIFYNTFISTKLALVNMVQDVAEKNGNMNVDVVTNALANSTYRIMGPAYMKAGLGDAGACHPRDNIALRYMAENLNLGYDLFDSIMTAREVQAENMALRCLKNGKNVTIIGKAYKPGVPYTNGSASMLVGHYIEKHGGSVHYYDLNTGDTDMKTMWTDVYLIGYWEEWVEQLTFPFGVTVIDPWRKRIARETIHYGDTRNQQTYVYPKYYEEFSVKWVNRIWPELSTVLDKVYFIYANYNTDYALTNYSVEFMANHIIEQYNNGKKYFFFESFAEPLVYAAFKKIHNIIDQVYKYVPDIKFFFLTGVVNGQEVYNKFLIEYNKSPLLTILAGRFFESVVPFYTANYTPDTYEVKLKDKKFVAFNRVPRPHRVYLMEYLLENNRIDNGYVSFGYDGEWERQTRPWLEMLKDRFPNINKNIDIFPLNINASEERNNPADVRIEDIQYYENSYFSIVTETQYFAYGSSDICNYVEPNIFPSEKVYKPLALLHPFILMARPRFLEALRKHGYKTFHPYIDETYDTIEDDYERLEYIYREIDRLSNLSDQEYLVWMEKIKPIVEYNKDFLFNQNTEYRVTKDILKYFE